MSNTFRFGLRIPPCASATDIAACVRDEPDEVRPIGIGQLGIARTAEQHSPGTASGRKGARCRSHA